MSSETKIVGGVIIATFVILIGGVLLLSKGDGNSASAENIISKTSIHWHLKLSVYIKGERQEFTGDIGRGAIHEPIHTHDEDYTEGVVHMEMNPVVTKDQTKLGRFFQIWGKQFNGSCLFDKCNGSEGTVRMIVNGSENKDYENYLMKDGDNIEIRYE